MFLTDENAIAIHITQVKMLLRKGFSIGASACNITE